MPQKTSMGTLWLWMIALLHGALPCMAAVVDANPANYRALLRTLKPGDTLRLARGRYPRLSIAGLNGTSEAWITITGPKSGPPAVIDGQFYFNTIEIVDSSYVAIESLRIDSHHVNGAVGISATGGVSNVTHHIRIEGNVLVGQNGNQQTDGISTKTPTWGWIIRNNQILGAGAGLNLGSSDGTDPFVAGLIENNLIKNTIGYNLRIAYQTKFPSIDGLPAGPTSTIIRNNVFIKDDQRSPGGNRPNVLLGAFPGDGSGSLNMYEVYGNYFLHNHREALLEATGRVTLHDNVFVDGPHESPAIVLQKKDDDLKVAYVYNNTVYTWERGIFFGSKALAGDAVAGNLIFASNPISGPITHVSDNVVDTVENASKYVRLPSFEPGSMDFSPLPGKCQGAAIDLSPFYKDADYARDFNGRPKITGKGAVVFRGAYAGDGANPGWRLNADLKPPFELSPTPRVMLVWMNPASAQAGTATVTFTGANFTPGAIVAVSGKGVTAGEVTLAGDSQLTATLQIGRDAAASTRDVTIKTPSGTSNALKFRITKKP
jgi:hypothetical protein